jgi:Amt family ammonium transporter
MFFNAGSTLAITGESIFVLGTAGMNTMLSGASGGLTVFLLHYYLSESPSSRYSLVMLCNGNLAGLVAVTGPCDNIEAWAAILTGTIGGFGYVFA